MLVRAVNMRGVNLSIFDFDYDLEWAALFLHADGTVYGRFGGASAGSDDRYLTLPALRHAMQHALEQHRRHRPVADRPFPVKVETVDQYPGARRLRPSNCIHCHQVYDFRNEEREAAGTLTRNDLWVYPLPENVGLTVDPDQGNRVKSVAAGSGAERIGLQGGDILGQVNGFPVASFADLQYALHRSPAQGQVPISWLRNGKQQAALLTLPAGWRQTDLSWRASIKRIGPDPCVDGYDLTADEKKTLGLPPRVVAFRQGNFVGTTARQAGIRQNDVIIGINRELLEMNVAQFRTHIRLNFKPGDQVTFRVLRNGELLELPLTLPRRGP